MNFKILIQGAETRDVKFRFVVETGLDYESEGLHRVTFLR
jgi:hypothetical protein